MTNNISELTADDFFESLTGFEEIAIAKTFGGEWQELIGGKPVMFLRALAYIHFKRESVAEGDAKKQAMNLTVKQANDFFAEDEEEPFPEEPSTESGKGDEQTD